MWLHSTEGLAGTSTQRVSRFSVFCAARTRHELQAQAFTRDLLGSSGTSRGPDIHGQSGGGVRGRGCELQALINFQIKCDKRKDQGANGINRTACAKLTATNCIKEAVKCIMTYAFAACSEIRHFTLNFPAMNIDNCLALGPRLAQVDIAKGAKDKNGWILASVRERFRVRPVTTFRSQRFAG